MKSIIILLLILCVSLVSARTIDFFANDTKSNIFAPLNEQTRSIIFQGFDAFVDHILSSSSNWNWSEKKRLFLEMVHSPSKHDLMTTDLMKNNTKQNFVKDILMSERLETTDFNRIMQKMIDFITEIEITYKHGMQYNDWINEIDNFPLNNQRKKELLKFVDNILQAKLDENNLQYSYSRFIEDILDSNYPQYKHFNTRFFDLIKDNVCSMQQSQQIILSNFFGHIALAEVQRYLTVIMAYEIHKVMLGRDEYVDWLMKSKLKKTAHYLAMYKKTMEMMVVSSATREVRKCDPKFYIEGRTYTMLKDTFKEYTKQEKNLNCHISYQTKCHQLSDTSDRYFNLQPVFSNVYVNSVVTGARLIKRNHVIHIQVQEGQLLPNGTVNTSSIIWSPIKEYTTYSHVLKWDGSRSVDLNDLLVPDSPHSVLTGISFDSIKIGFEERLRLIIYSTPFNFTTGKLKYNDDEFPWKVQFPKISSTELPLKSQAMPIFSKSPNIPDSQNNQTLKLTVTNSRKGDGTIVPFIDIQPVETIPPSPMSGAGLYHKGSDGSSGFLALKLFTYNIIPYLKI